MKVLQYSYRFASDILTNPNNENIYKELLEICQNTPVPIYSGKSAKQPQLDVVQQILNTYFNLRFKDFGWEEEPLATPDENVDSLRSDFRKTFILKNGEKMTLQIEVEFGNAASVYRNLFKFQLSFSYSLTDICILILPDYALSKRIDSGVANFQKVIREIPSAKLSISVPILVIGLTSDEAYLWNVKAIEPDLKILKGDENAYKEKHRKIVRKHIDSL